MYVRQHSNTPKKRKENMGYRRKTCSYCAGDHAILDCNKLIENAALAEKALLEWDEVGAPAHRKNVVVYSAYERKRNTNPKTREEDPYVFQRTHFSEALKHYGWLLDHEDFDIEEWRKLPEYVSEEQYREASNGRWLSAQSYQHTINRNTEVRARANSRAQKSCSYCRQSGHTVRTCQQKRADQDMHLKAYKISAYHYARALSRFGVWTGSMMVETSGNDVMPKMLHTDVFKAPLMAISLDNMSFYEDYSKPPVQVSAWAESMNLSLDDVFDYLYLSRAVNDSLLYTAVGSEFSRYGSDSRRVTIAQIGDIIPAFSDGSLDGISLAKEAKLYPSTASLEHIYGVLLSRYKPTAQKDKYSDTNSMATAAVSRGACFYFSSRGLYEKKQRSSSWETVETFVEQNQETLNIADSLNV